MSITNIGGQSRNFLTNYNQIQCCNNQQARFSEISSVSTMSDEKNDNEVLGISMIKDEKSNIFYGMNAQYAKDSTSDNPIIQVTSNYGGKTVAYNVNINEVDPQNASKLEMFALCSYADDVGLGTDSTFGSYNAAKYYEINANDNGYISSENTFESFINTKLNWIEMCQRMMTDYYEAGLYGQYKEGQNLIRFFSEYPNI